MSGYKAAGRKAKLLLIALKLIDILGAPVTVVSALWLKKLRRAGLKRMVVSRWIFDRVGMLPVIDHYYEPMISRRQLSTPLDASRDLPGIDLNIEVQLGLLNKFNYSDELKALPRNDAEGFFYHNGSFEAGDAEFYYSFIRSLKPKRIIEIGSGASTLLALEAISRNQLDNPAYACRVTCVEPFEQSWLESSGLEIIRKRVENVDPNIFSELENGDVLFIDSSHVIRPRGDVLFEILQVLPLIKPGVYVHVHDVFTPHEYPEDWLFGAVRLWDEQYILEAFMSCNSDFEVVGALSYLKSEYPDEVKRCFPVLAEEFSTKNPGSFWIRRKVA